MTDPAAIIADLRELLRQAADGISRGVPDLDLAARCRAAGTGGPITTKASVGLQANAAPAVPSDELLAARVKFASAKMLLTEYMKSHDDGCPCDTCSDARALLAPDPG